MKKMKLLVLALASLVGPPRGEPMMLANEKTKPNYKKMHAEAIGISPDAADDEAETAHSEHMELANEMADDMDDSSLDNEKGKEQLVKKPADEKTTDDDRATKAEKRATDLLIANALSEGRILPAAKTEWEGKFANDFDAAEAALKTEVKKLRTTSRTGNLGAANLGVMANESERRDKWDGLIANEMEKNGGDYTRAYNTVRHSNKELFGAMKQPEAKK